MSFKKDLIKLLNDLADLMEFNGENKFKIGAFRNGANTIRRLEGDLENMIADKSLKDVKGIGKGLLSVIEEFSATGSCSEYESLLEKVPDGIMDLFEIRGIGAKKVRAIYDELGVTSLESLEQACVNDNISGLKGFGSKIQDKILEEIRLIKRSRGFMLLNKAIRTGEHFKGIIKSLEKVSQVEFTGELRRKSEVINRIELIVEIEDYKTYYKDCLNLFNINELEVADSYIQLQIRTEDNSEVFLFITDRYNFNYVWFITTGSKEYLDKNEFIPEQADYKSEQELVQKLGIEYINPEMREGAYHAAPTNLRVNSNLCGENLAGFLHFHTTKSDGQNTLREMAEAALKLGFKYAVVCDHSKSAYYANGLDEDRVLLQSKEIEDVSKETGMKVFHGIESDILRDGSLDYSDEFMKNFQFVVASIHSIFNISEEEMTRRMIRAIENPNTDIIAHPTGRLLLTRDPYRIDINKIIDACAANDVAIEVNASPYRLDLDWRHYYYAREKGCKFSINPDAHSIEGIEDILYGIMVARKGGIQPDEVINCYSQDNFEKYINRKIKRK